MAKGILDWNGTGAARIQRVYDHNGTTATQLKKAYDWNGTAATPVYSAETVLFSGGSTADSGTWSSGGVGYTNAGSPVVTTYLGFGAGKCNSYFGALLWTGKRISMTQGQKLSFYMDSTAYSTYDTNLANGTQHLCRLEVVRVQQALHRGGDRRARQGGRKLPHHHGGQRLSGVLRLGGIRQHEGRDLYRDHSGDGHLLSGLSLERL